MSGAYSSIPSLPQSPDPVCLLNGSTQGKAALILQTDRHPTQHFARLEVAVWATAFSLSGFRTTEQRFDSAPGYFPGKKLPRGRQPQRQCGYDGPGGREHARASGLINVNTTPGEVPGDALGTSRVADRRGFRSARGWRRYAEGLETLCRGKRRGTGLTNYQQHWQASAVLVATSARFEPVMPGINRCPHYSARQRSILTLESVFQDIEGKEANQRGAVDAEATVKMISSGRSALSPCR